MPQTFAQYLINKILPPDIRVIRPVDKSYMKEILVEVGRKHPEKFDEVVSNLKRLADHMATMEALTIGLDEIDVPNREKRDAIIKKYQAQLEKDKAAGDERKMIENLGKLQHELAENDLKGMKDDASVMVRASLTGKKTQLMKMRTSPGVVGDHSGGVVPEIFPKSYAQGVDPLHFWLGATESRKNIAEGQVNTAKPGEMNKVLGNVLAGCVVSAEDCGTHQGILLSARDDSIIDRYLARDTGKYKRNQLITPDMQQDFLKSGIANVLVRSPQTCAAKASTVCRMCMGIRPGTGKKYEIGDNAGMITAGNIGEPLTQMTLSAKHSTSMAEVHDELRGEKGLRQFIESPENYPNRKVLCEVIGQIMYIRPAPQGGKIITIRQTRPVPERYIVHGLKNQKLRQHWDYYIPPNLRVAEGVKEGIEVYPGFALSNGVDNLRDMARLRNLGFARSVSSENMYNIYKHTGMKLDRRHFELLSRASNPYVKIVKAPEGSGLLPGDTITYQELVAKAKSLPKRTVPVRDALGGVLAEGVLDLTIGTEIDIPCQKRLMDNNVQNVSVTRSLEVEAVSVPMTRVVNQSGDWLSQLNHRHLKTALKDAATLGKKSNIHGYNPVTAYAYGAEFGHGEAGNY